MKRANKTQQVQRALRLATFLYGSRRTLDEILAEFGVSLRTFRRDCQRLRKAGVALHTLEDDGRVFYTVRKRVPTAHHSEDFKLGIKLASSLLRPLYGTDLHNEIERTNTDDGSGFCLTIQHVDLSEKYASIAEKLERAVRKEQRVKIAYRNARNESTEHEIEPYMFLVGDFAYVIGHLVSKDSVTLFKLMRIESVRYVSDRSSSHTRAEIERMFSCAQKTWIGERVKVVVRLRPAVAHLIHEYPLHLNQKLAQLKDGSVEVRAEVNGTKEAARWVLSWGINAEALEPKELRQELAHELRETTRLYAS